MKVGDLARVLRGNEEGIIRKISGSRVEIEIEDGFLIPVLKSEIVVVQKAAESHLTDEDSINSSDTSHSTTSKTTEPLSLVFVPINDREYSIYLVNGTSESFLILVNLVEGGNQESIYADRLESNSTAKVSQFLFSDFDNWNGISIKCLPISKQKSPEKPGLEHKLKLHPSRFQRPKVMVSMLNQKGYSFPLNQAEKELNIQQLNAELNKDSFEDPAPRSKPSDRIDLHIEELVNNSEGMSNSEMMRIQMEAFESALNQAIAYGLEEITFVHGIGNGVLRKEIHKRLSQLKNIKYFQDTQKDKWGYGATRVRIS